MGTTGDWVLGSLQLRGEREREREIDCCLRMKVEVHDLNNN